jgi:hypothetical protein
MNNGVRRVFMGEGRICADEMQLVSSCSDMYRHDVQQIIKLAISLKGFVGCKNFLYCVALRSSGGESNFSKFPIQYFR